MTGRTSGSAVTARRTLALFCWAYFVWLLLSWTFTAEQLLVGAGIALVVAVALAPLGDVPGPWRLANPLRLWAVVRLACSTTVRLVKANIGLAKRIWTPRLPLASGVVIVSTTADTDGELAAVGLISSLIVDNQIVDLDRARHLLSYHAVYVPPGDPDAARAAINEPVERLLPAIFRRR